MLLSVDEGNKVVHCLEGSRLRWLRILHCLGTPSPGTILRFRVKGVKFRVPKLGGGAFKGGYRSYYRDYLGFKSFQKIRDSFLGVPIVRISSWGSTLGPPYSKKNYHMGASKGSCASQFP